MNKRLQGFFAGILMGVIITSGFVFAEDISKTINAVYMNVKLVVDGIQIEPKDANGNYVEPFIYNGTTYLPVRAVGKAFGKDVSWDGDTATVYIGGKVDKPAKDILVWNKPYLEVSDLPYFRTYTESGNGYLDFMFDASNRQSFKYPLYTGSNDVVYALNGQCKKVSGIIKADYVEYSGHQFVLTFSDENEKTLYTSPIITESTEAIPFSFDTTNELKLKISAKWIGPHTANTAHFVIENLKFTTTDY